LITNRLFFFNWLRGSIKLTITQIAVHEIL
jgi:hypothetical protein